MSNANNKLNKLIDLKVDEVSFVSKGAIGEVFMIIKSADEEIVIDVEKVANTQKVTEAITNMNDSDFVTMMRQMMSTYTEINKTEGGQENMDPKEIKDLLDTFMDTVNKNFVAVNKSIGEIQAKVEEVKKAEEEVKPVVEPAKTEDSSEVKGAIEEVAKSVKSLADAVSLISKTVEMVPELKESINKISEMKLDEKLNDVAGRVDTIEKEENTSNALKDDETEVKKTVTSKWPSFGR